MLIMRRKKAWISDHLISKYFSGGITSPSTDSSSLSETTNEVSSPQRKGYHTEHKKTFLNFEFNSVLYLQAMNLLWNQLLNKDHLQVASHEAPIVKKKII